MDSKNIGLCSVNFEFTQDAAKKFHAKTGTGYIVFSEIAYDYISENIAEINKARTKSNLQRIILPAINYMRDKYSDVRIVLLDMEVLMHDEAVTELKKNYCLVFLQSAPAAKDVEHILYKEYNERLEKIADVKIKNIEEAL